MVPKTLTITPILPCNLLSIPPPRPRNLTLQPHPSQLPPPSPEPPVCRICLDQCPNTPFCHCKGSSMIHQKCLKLYLLKGQGNFTSRSQCQICKFPYRIISNKRCLFSCSNGYQQLKQHLTASILYFLYTILTLIYVGYCSHLNSSGNLDANLQLILLIVGICLCIAMLVITLKWSISNLWVKVIVLQRVLPVERIVRALSMCPMRDEGEMNETMEEM